MNLQDAYKEKIRVALEKVFQETFSAELPENLQFTLPPGIELGHISLPCFDFAKILRQSPQKIAAKIVEQFPPVKGIQKTLAEGTYVNFFLEPHFLCEEIANAIHLPAFFENTLKKDKKIMVEYSSPNTNKPLHLGHGRNNMLGHSISNLLKLSGAEVVQANLVNDRGIHICKSMLAYQKFGQGKTPETENIKGDHFVGDYYVLYAQNETPELLKEAEQMLRDWESEKPEVRELWNLMKKWVLHGFEETYRRMDIRFDQYYYESETYHKGKAEILEALKKGICQKEENGAISIDLSEYKLGKKILLRSDGTAVYITQDIFTTIKKFGDFSLDETVFVVGNEQDHHFRVLFSILKEFGYGKNSDHCKHVSYGMIELPDGKMKSREGKTVDLDDLLDELRIKALEQLALREKERKNPRSESELSEVAEAVGQAALKYFILRTGISKNMVFFPEESLSFEGNTGPYLQYTHARISTMLKKAEFTEFDFPEEHNWQTTEEALLIQILRCSDAIRKSARELNPAVLAGYCYDLAKIFNKFYGELPVLKAKETEKNLRLGLSLICKMTLGKCLKIMGIVPLERM